MVWTIPDKGEGDNDLQSILFQEYLEVLVEGLSGVACVLSGCAVTGGADMTPAVAKGAVLSNGVVFPVTAGDVTIGAADATNPRIDLIVVNSSGTKAVRAGTAAANPKPPARTANDVVLAAVYVPANDTSIETTKCVDLRVKPPTPTLLYKQTAADTINNTAAAIELLNRTNSGVTFPSGLFLAGKIARVRMGGNMLLNNGTPTVRIVIAYGGTTMFSDLSGTSTADADRAAWYLDFDLVAQGDADQTVNGILGMGIIAAKTAPTTGIGDAWSTANNVNAISGSAAVDSDTADRKLSVQLTFSVANGANEVVVEYATVELLG